MQELLRHLSLLSLLAPLAGAFIAGVFGRKIGKTAAHWVTILGVSIAFVCSLYLFKLLIIDAVTPFNDVIYTWAMSSNFTFNVGLLIDRLTVAMMATVTFVSLLVHIYSVGYMHDDSGYQRFFAYMSLFTFFMLILVTANNFALLFFGWEGVGLVSYLLIGFWFNRESAAQGSLKAFIVNRVGDFGFILGIAAVLNYFGTLDYAKVFAAAPQFAHTTVHIFNGVNWSVISIICILLFIGAMGKSAQIPLHVWLPESMEGPTPISALIHAATMVTAGVYMVVRMSPLYELSPTALSVVLVIGATGALFLGLVAVVQNDIKRVIAYSTMSQLGYMMAATGASAFSVGMFHLMTHACFKALLFLAAGSVIIALHHEQDVRKMGNLYKYMPITYACFLIGALALAAIPPFSGFYSKDVIIEAVHISTIPGAIYAYVCLLLATFVTGFYIFRIFFLVFHTKERTDEKLRSHIKESPWVITIPLIVFAIPSIFLGMVLIKPMIAGTQGLLANSIYVAPVYDVLSKIAGDYQNGLMTLLDGFKEPPLWFALAGIFTAWICYVRFPLLPTLICQRFRILYKILVNKYGFDAFNNKVFVKEGIKFSQFLFNVTDVKWLDGAVVNGSGRGITHISQWLRRIQSGYLYHYVFVMILFVLIFLAWLVFK